MPRLKLPKPAKRHIRRLKHAERIGKGTRNTTLAASAGYAKGYDHALRDAHESINKSRRRSERARWNTNEFLARLREQKMQAVETCPCKACTDKRRADAPLNPGDMLATGSPRGIMPG